MLLRFEKAARCLISRSNSLESLGGSGMPLTLESVGGTGMPLTEEAGVLRASPLRHKQCHSPADPKEEAGVLRAGPLRHNQSCSPNDPFACLRVQTGWMLCSVIFLQSLLKGMEISARSKGKHTTPAPVLWFIWS